MDLNELLGDLDTEKATVVREAIEAEKQRGITAAREKNREAEGLRKTLIEMKRTLADVGLDPEKDLAEQMQEIKSRDSGEMGSLQKQVEQLTKKVADSQAAAEAQAQKLRRAKAQAKAVDVFGGRLLAGEHIIRNLLEDGHVSVGSDGETVVWVDGETEIDIAEGAKKYMEQHPEYVKAEPKPGSGNPPNGGGGGGSGTKYIKRDQYDAMGHSAKLDTMKAVAEGTAKLID